MYQINTSKYKYIENREILKINPTILKLIIDKCYCKHVNEKEHKNLYEELSALSGLYSYIKDKKI